MARIELSQCKVSIYKYTLKGHPSKQWCPIIVVDVPFSISQVSSGSNPIYYYGNRVDPSVTFDMLGLADTTFPLWTYLFKYDTPLTYLEVYTDDNIKIMQTLKDLGNNIGYQSSLTVSMLNTDGTANQLKNISISSSGSKPEQAQSIIFLTFRTTDNYCSNYDFLIDNISELNNNVYKVLTTPISSTKKGSFNTYGNSHIHTNDVYWYYNSKTGDTLNRMLKESKVLDVNDPIDGGGNSSGGGGGGDGNIGGDENSDDGLPTIQATDSGLMTLYNPTTSELQSLGRFLWSDQWSLDNFKKLFNDPFDTLLGLSVIPVKPNTGGSKNIMFGNLDSGVSSAIITNQWLEKDMGSVTLNEVWKGALDYSPSTSVSIYLPFIGMRQLNVNDVMGSTVHLMYKFDVLTGTCVAQLYVNHNAQGNKDGGFSWNKNQGLLYEFIGQCSVNIPLASQDFTNTIRAAISAVGMTTGAAASIATGNPALGLASLTVGTANTGMQANTPTVERSGHLSGSSAILGYYQPFLVVERPHQCKPSRYYALRGIPSQVYVSKLADCTGFTQITDNNNIHASGAQDTELEEIERLLSSGVYFPNKKR